MKIFKLVLIFFTLLCVLSSCAIQKVDDRLTLACISEKELVDKRKQLKPILPRLSGKKAGAFKNQWEIIRDECWKQLYKIDDIYVFLNRDHKSNKILAQLSGTMWEKAPIGCLEEAIEDTLDLKLTYSRDIIEASKGFYGPLWNDPDVGASSWLACKQQKNKTSEYYGSLDTFAHELNHLAADKEKNCSFYPWKNRHDCFPKNKKDSYLQQLGVSKKLISLDKKTKDSILSTQTMYLGNSKSSKNSVILLDELRSYIVGLEHMGAVLKKHGKKGLYSEKKKRPTLMPLMAVYDLVSRYRLGRLKIDKEFKDSKLNYLMLQSLDLASKTIHQWKNIEEKLGDKNSKAASIEGKVWEIFSSKVKK